MDELLSKLIGITDTKLEILRLVKKLALKFESKGLHLTSGDIQDMIDDITRHYKTKELDQAMERTFGKNND